MPDLFERLGVDWKLLLFQVVNFLILLFILKKFLYKPISNFLEQRRKKIEEGLKKAEKFTEEWLRIQDIKKGELVKAEKEAVQIMEGARKDAEKKEKEILESAHQKKEKLVEEAKGEISREKEKILDEAKKETAECVVWATEKILKRALKDKDEKNLIDEALKALEKHE